MWNFLFMRKIKWYEEETSYEAYKIIVVEKIRLFLKFRIFLWTTGARWLWIINKTSNIFYHKRLKLIKKIKS